MILNDKSEYCCLTKGSHKVLNVKCDFGATIKCRDIMRKQYKTIVRDRKLSEGKDMCFFCSRLLKYSGRKNPNCKYKFDDNFFESIDSEEKGYFLGWIASDGSVSGSTITISIHKKDIDVLEKLVDIFCKDLPIAERKDNQVSISINSKRISKNVCEHLGIDPGKKSNIIKFPHHISYKWEFLRGYFDGDGHVCKINNRRYPRCGITSSSIDMLDGISNFISNSPHSRYKDRIELSGNNALDFLGKLYNDASIYMARKRDLYLDWCAWVPSLSGNGAHGKNLLFKWNKARVDAVAPSKDRVSDSGYDLVVLEKVKTFGNVELWDTGIKITPEFGWYFDMVPRSSIIKTGYMLANSIGIIDRTYVGNIMVPLVKIDDNAPPISSGDRLVQLIPRPIIHAEIEEVDELDDTDRGKGGFGSSGK